MSVLERIINLLESNSIDYEKTNHLAVYTSEEAAKVRGTDISIGAKALVFIADGKPILLVLPGNTKVDTRKVKDVLKIKDLRMATREEVKEITTLEVGSIPPIGSVLGISSYYDSSIKSKEYVAFNAGDHCVTIVMKAEDLINVENPVLLDISRTE